jgi:hypothetical protein
MESATSLMPPITGLRDTHFSTLKSDQISDHERPEKYNDTEMKNRASFTAAKQHLAPTVVMY